MAKKKVFATNVHVERDGEPVVLTAGSPVPGWAKDLVTNPKAFASVEVPDEEPAASGPTGQGEQPQATDSEKSEYVAKRAGVDDVPPYDQWAYHELQAEAGANGRALDGGGQGKQDELIARLAADDAAQAGK